MNINRTLIFEAILHRGINSSHCYGFHANEACKDVTAPYPNSLSTIHLLSNNHSPIAIHDTAQEYTSVATQPYAWIVNPFESTAVA